MFANNRHLKIAGTAPTELGRQSQPQPTSRISPTSHFPEQLFPVGTRNTIVVVVGTGPFSTMVKESLIVVLRLKRLDLAFNEGVEVTQGLLDRFGNAEVHDLTVIPSVFASAPRRDQG